MVAGAKPSPKREMPMNDTYSYSYVEVLEILKHISKDYVSDILVPIIDIDEQNEIVYNLDLINDKLKNM